MTQDLIGNCDCGPCNDRTDRSDRILDWNKLVFVPLSDATPQISHRTSARPARDSTIPFAAPPDSATVLVFLGPAVGNDDFRPWLVTEVIDLVV
jgi:hypothetical protein